MSASDRPVMVVIHKCPEDLKAGAGPHIFWDWNRWFDEKKLVVVEKWIQDTSWKDIRDAIPR